MKGVISGMTAKDYERHKQRNPNCTCMYDEYGGCLHFAVDCPQHGEKEVRPTSVPRKVKRAYDPPPAHYDGGNGIDNWAIWDAYDLDRYTANAVKYILRAGKKSIAPRLDDLRKARNYINKAIEMEEKREADQGS